MPKKQRRRLRVRSPHISTERSPYTEGSNWDGVYKQRFKFHNSENQTDLQADLSLSEIDYWIARLEEGRSQLCTRMLRQINKSNP